MLANERVFKTLVEALAETWAAALEKAPAADVKAFRDARVHTDSILRRFTKNPYDMRLLQECDDNVREYERIASSKVSRIERNRARNNLVMMSSRSRRTHYAAYMAGKFSVDPDVDAEFKVGMINAAAHGAMSLHELVLAMERRHVVPPPGGEAGREMAGALHIFSAGAAQDASRFLVRAREWMSACCLTQYNAGKLEILDGNVESGIEMLRGIEPPTEASHPAELLWHRNNRTSFVDSDGFLRELIDEFDDEACKHIEYVLRRCEAAADAELARRGDALWGEMEATAKRRRVWIAAALGLVLMSATTYAGIPADEHARIVDGTGRVVQEATIDGEGPARLESGRSSRTRRPDARTSGGTPLARGDGGPMRNLIAARGDGGPMRGDGGPMHSDGDAGAGSAGVGSPSEFVRAVSRSDGGLAKALYAVGVGGGGGGPMM